MLILDQFNKLILLQVKIEQEIQQCFLLFSHVFHVSLFSVADNNNFSATNLNSDLGKINAWASHWKITFNPDSNKQAQEVIFFVKQKRHHSLL